MNFLEERDFNDIPNIPEYYKDKTIFITGGSGFMGKVLVEKLLYSCSDLNRIYLLLREKKGVKSEERLDAIYTSKCFDRLRNEKPDIFKQKVFFIAGDASELGLGISDEDRTLIINRTNIIFHVAASVRFDDSLKVAAQLNLRGTREVIELAKEVRNLEPAANSDEACDGSASTIAFNFSLSTWVSGHLRGLFCSNKIMRCVQYGFNEGKYGVRSVELDLIASYRDQKVQTVDVNNSKSAGSKDGFGILVALKAVPNLVHVHVSTSYANAGNGNCIDEVIYPALADWRDTLEVSEKLDEHTLKLLTPKYLGEIPNTYVFTKQLAEHVVAEQRGKLPVVIIRPTIVIASHREPLVGWLENFNGPVGLLIAISLGILRVLFTSADIEPDFIPVDIAIKLFIAAAWERGTKKTLPTDQMQVYNCSSGHMKTMSVGDIAEYGITILQNEMTLEKSLWPHGISFTTSKLEYDLKVLLLHFLPAFLLDLGLKISGNKPMLLKIQRRICVANIALHYFLTQQWKFTNENILTLRSKIKEEDIKDFFFEMETIDLKEYYKNASLGAKIYIFKEKMENMAKAKKRLMWKTLLDKTLKIAFKAYVFWFVINTQFVLNILQSVYSFILGI